jgi:hypothetical protein
MLIFVSSASATDFRGVNDVITTVDRHHMYQTNYPANILSPADKTAARRGHEEGVAKLKDLVQEEDKRLAAWSKRCGAILASFLALMVVSASVGDAYHVFWSRPNTGLNSGSVLILGYDRAPSKRYSRFPLLSSDFVSS